MASNLANMDPASMKIVQDLEIDMMADMFTRLSSACHAKCIPREYREGELNKGEAVCLDRCVAKYLETHEKIGKKLTEMSVQQDPEFLKRVEEQNVKIKPWKS